jgi:hypothetical protein
MTVADADVAQTGALQARRRAWSVWRAAPGRPLHDARERALASAALAAGALAAVATAAGDGPSSLRFAAVLGFLCLAPGAAVIARLGGRPEPGLVIGAGLGIGTVLAQAMLWLGWWHPNACLYALVATCSASLALQLWGAGRRRAPAATPAVDAVRRAIARSGAATFGHLALVAVALAAWGVSLTRIDLARISGVGLLGAMPPLWFAAFGLLLAGGAVALTRPRLSPWVLGVYLVSVVLVVHGTTPLLYTEPRYPWVYKHIAVVDLIAHGGHVSRGVDIYNNWPGFFALSAWLTRVSGLSPLAYAPWAQVVFNLAWLAAVRFAVRGVTGNDRVVWIAMWLFLLGNWMGQDYFSPQAFAVVLALVVLGLCVRCGPAPVPPRSRAARWWTARVDGLRAGLVGGSAVPEAPVPAPLSPSAAVAVGAPCWLALVVSHQLTPVMVFAGVVGLALFVHRVPWWVVAAMGLVEAWWVALSWTYLTGHYDLFSIDPASSGAPPGYQAGRGLAGLAIVMDATHLGVVLVGALAVAGLVRRIRARHWDLAAVMLIVAPLVVVVLQSYSGEGRYRFYLLALPWLCFFVATWHAPSVRPVLARARLLAVTGVLGACLLFAYFGLEMENIITPGDVAAGAWFDRHAPQGSLIVEVAPDSVSRVTAQYARVFDPAFPSAPSLTDQPRFRGHTLGAADVPAIEALLRGYGAPHMFLIVNGAEERFARLYGILPDGWAGSLKGALGRSRAFHVVYDRAGASIYAFAPATTALRQGTTP